MEYKKTTLSNGLRVVVVSMPSLESATVTVWTGTGSRYEAKEQGGISHFLEHMGFKGGRKYTSAKAVSEAIDAIGGEFNASTSKHYTDYYVRTQNSKLPVAIDVLSDMLISPLLNDKDIKRERGVIIEEIGMYEDTPRSKIWDYFENLIFEGHTLGRDIIGSRETVSSLTRDNFIAYRDDQYVGPNMLVTVAGGVKDTEVVELIEKYFGELPNRQAKKHETFAFDSHNNRASVHYKDTEQANFVLGFPGYQYGHDRRYVEAVLDVILGKGMSSRLFTEIREKRGLAYSVTTNTEHFVDAGYFSVYAGVDPKKARDAVNVVKQELEKVSSAKHGISKGEFDKAKGFIEGHFTLGLESTEDVNDFFGTEEVLLGKLRDPREVLTGIEKVTVDEVVDMARELFDFSKMRLSIIGPFKNEEQFKVLV